MRKRWIGLACVVAVAGCGPQASANPSPGGTAPSAASPSPEGASGITRSVRSLGIGIGEPGPLAGFTAVVAPFGETGECKTIPTERGRLLLLTFVNGPGGAERNVSVEYDAAGHRVIYSDVRGDLMDRGGPMTSVSLNLADGTAHAMNTGGGARQFAMGSAQAALDMAALGTPRAVIAQIERECGPGGAK